MDGTHLYKRDVLELSRQLGLLLSKIRMLSFKHLKNLPVDLILIQNFCCFRTIHRRAGKTQNNNSAADCK